MRGLLGHVPLRALVVVAAVVLGVVAVPASAAPTTTVSFTFDDGRPSQLAAEQELVSRGMNATFYIITSQVGLPGVMSLSDLNKLKADGMEIGAHTVLHRNLQTLTSDEALRELCLSRNWLMDRGFSVYDMAYPYDLTNAAVKQAVAACGYSGARAGGQLQCDGDDDCSETVPPLDRYALRTPNAFETTTSLAQMKAMVTDAEASGGGWVPLELHDVCDGPGDPLLPPLAGCTAPGYVTRAVYRQFLDWLTGEVDAGRVQVKTVHEVLGGALQTQTTVAPPPARTGNLLVNPSFEQAGTNGAPAACWADFTNGPDHVPTVARTTTGPHSGSEALTITVPSGYDSWAYDFIAPALDLAQCSPAAIGSHRYTFSAWYKSNGAIKVAAFWRNADNQWARLDTGSAGTATFATAAAWTQGSLTFRAPAGATAVSAGFYLDTVTRGHSYTIDDASLVDEDAPGATSALTVNRTGAGSGSVTSTPAGIACGATCLASFTTGASVVLTAAAAPGSGFTGWSGGCSGTATTCTVTLTTATSVTASFAQVPVQLSVSKAGTGSGTVSAPAGIACGATCQTSVTYNTAVTLTAAAAPGSTFTGWSEAACAASSTCTVTLASDRAVTATFTADPPAPPAPPAADPGAADGAEAPAPRPVAVAPVAVVPVVTAPAATRPALKAAPKLGARPKLTGRAWVGRTLTCTRGTWTGIPTRFAFTWTRGLRVVGHGPTHVVRAADRGQVLRCTVTARNAGGASMAAGAALRVAR